MDINLARTFLEVASSGSFHAAADRLHVTQTAVSARIRTLEEQFGRKLFIRNKAGARLTPAGERFVRHATTLVQIWERARQHVALPPGREEGVSVGCELSLWQPLLADWLLWMHRECPQIGLRADVASAIQLLDRVQDGSIDIAVMYSPLQRPGLVLELLEEEKLVMVTSAADGSVDTEQYIYVDWGTSFAVNHEAAFPDLGSPPVSISLGPLALSHLLNVGGAGYFRQGSVQPLLSEGRLHLAKDAPPFSYSAYAVYAAQPENAGMEQSLKGLRLVASCLQKKTVKMKR